MSEDSKLPNAHINPAVLSEAEALWPQLMARLRAIPSSASLVEGVENIGVAVGRGFRDLRCELATVTADRDQARAVLAAATTELTGRERQLLERTINLHVRSPSAEYDELIDSIVALRNAARKPDKW